MPWGRLDDSLHDNEKIWSFTDKAFRVWMYSISVCNKKRKRDPDGHLTQEAALTVCRLAKAPPRVVDELVQKRGWDRLEGGGYVVHDFPDYGPKLDKTVNERVARHRDRQRGNAPETADVTPLPHAHANPVSVPSPVPHEASTQTEDQHTEATARPAAASPAAAPPSVRPAPKPSKRGASYDADFAAWWAVYPRHVGRVPAAESYEKRRSAGRSADELLAAARHYAAYVDDRGIENEKIAHGSTFLNQHRDLEWEHGPPDAGRRVVANGKAAAPSLREEAAARIAALRQPVGAPS